MTTFLPPGQFTRRVSFNNLEPELIDPSLQVGYGTSIGAYSNNNYLPTPSYSSNSFGASPFKPNYSLGSNQNAPSDLGYGSSPINDISKAYSQAPVKKKLRLPDPPEKSILKNKLSPQYIASETINYHGDVDAAVNAAANAAGGADSDGNGSFSAPAPRRKSYSEMTYEELNALDPQYQTTKSKTSNVNQFKFDSQKTYYSPARKVSTSGPASAKQAEYPSSNENNYKSISLTVKHKKFDNVSQRTRTILSVISGRRHTWNAVDWLFSKMGDSNEDDPKPQLDESSSATFLQDGDYVVISALIPPKFMKEYPKRHKKCSINDYLYKKCEHLLNYIISGPLLSSNTDLRLKITVEFVTDFDSGNSNVNGNKYMLQQLFEQYQPSLVVLGNKSSNLNFRYPKKIRKNNERDEYLIKLSSYVIKYSTVPVLLVGNSTRFHNKTGYEVASAGKQSLTFDLSYPQRRSTSKETPTVSSLLSPGTTGGDSAGETITSFVGESGSHRGSTSSSVSISSTESGSPTALEQSAQPERLQDTSKYIASLEDIVDAPNTENKFADWIALISDKSAVDSRNYLVAVASKDDALKIDSKIHAIYRSQTSNLPDDPDSSISRRGSHDSGNGPSSAEKIYKVKSLISYSDKDELKNEKLRNELKKRRSSGSRPKVEEVEPTPRKSSIWQKLKLKK